MEEERESDDGRRGERKDKSFILAPPPPFFIAPLAHSHAYLFHLPPVFERLKEIFREKWVTFRVRRQKYIYVLRLHEDEIIQFNPHLNIKRSYTNKELHYRYM